MVVPMGWLQLVNLVLVHVVVFLVTVPLQYGALSQFHYVLLGQPRTFRALLDWYLDLRLTAKALAAEVLLALWRGATSALCLLPSLACLLAGTVMSSAPLLSLSFPLLLLGLGAGYFCYLQLLPAQYLLAQRPQLGLGDAFSRAWRLLKGQRFSFFLLDLSFLPWYIVSLFLWGSRTCSSSLCIPHEPPLSGRSGGPCMSARARPLRPRPYPRRLRRSV